VYYVPAKLFRELTVVNGELKEISPPEIVKRVNEATLFRTEAVAARILPKSGDINITFKEEAWE